MEFRDFAVQIQGQSCRVGFAGEAEEFVTCFSSDPALLFCSGEMKKHSLLSPHLPSAPETSPLLWYLDRKKEFVDK